MKLAVPVLGIVVAAGGCCCCGDFTDDLAELGIPMDDVVVEAPMGEPVPSGDAPAAAATGGGSVSALGGTCGRFKEMGLGAPSGFSVLACSDSDGTGGLTIKGSGSPKDACETMKTWIKDNGWNITLESGMGGANTLMSEKGSEQLVVSCNNMTGETMIAVALTPK